jgi:hypothetical protein
VGVEITHPVADICHHTIDVDDGQGPLPLGCGAPACQDNHGQTVR